MFQTRCAPGYGRFLGKSSSQTPFPGTSMIPGRFAIVPSLSRSTVCSLEGFRTIGTGIYLRDSHEQCQDTKCPNVILIFGWLGAHPRHLRNYISAYAKLYPKASQIVVQCNADLLWTTTSTRSRKLKPVIDALEALHCLPSSPAPRPARILTHVFSNGGSLQMTLLGHMLQQKYGSAPVLESSASALILDSCPAAGDLKSVKRVVRTVIQNPIARHIVLAIVHAVYSVRFGLSLLFGKQMIMLEKLQIEMWNPSILSWMGLHTPRLYLFSRRDELISWQEVSRHAEIAKEHGMDVRCELFEESAHVAHARVEPERYWSSVQEVWSVATKGKNKD
ncbi:uncharacterized protein EDB93DRAFT_1118668 [Suillus bovinus]|uniref:uncharacterized protein n=1 Tax=Suillus bovinus TaxID=48563 RepID=UPI001B885E1A|nr:uncharacterized protein EDB93DRAFT_1118668 [Suillus bovinus]KAG2159172.1 hypothetical protein EDB93DRAFT_1118668 [Suillus bovinus]